MRHPSQFRVAADDDKWLPHFAWTPEEKLAHCEKEHISGYGTFQEELDEVTEELERVTSNLEDARRDGHDLKRAGKDLKVGMAQVLIDMSRLRSNLLFAETGPFAMDIFHSIERQLAEMNRKLGKDF